MKNYYEILEVEQTATKEEIKAAYQGLSKQMMQEQRNNERFFELLDAYSVLSNDKKRALYDSNLQQGITKFNFVEDDVPEEPVETFDTEIKGSTKRRVLQGTTGIIAAFIIFKIFSSGEDHKEDLENTAEIVETKIASVEESKIKEPEEEPKPTKVEESKPPVAEEVKPKPERIVEPKPAPVHDKVEVIPVVNRLPSTAGPKVEIAPADNETPSLTKTTPARINTPTRINKKSSKVLAVKKDHQDGVIQRDFTSNKVVKRELAKAELIDIVNTVLTERTNAAGASNCIRILKSSESNIENPFAVAPLLQEEGFVISGRGYTKEPADGIKVDINNNCMLLTIGIVPLQKEIAVRTGNKQGNKENKTSEEKTNTVKIKFEKTLSEAEMNEIINSIIARGAKNNNTTAPCISVMQSVESNVKNGFAIIPALQAKGFFISGRGFTKENADKVKVDYGSSCISITIGNFEQ